MLSTCACTLSSLVPLDGFHHLVCGAHRLHGGVPLVKDRRVALRKAGPLRRSRVSGHGIFLNSDVDAGTVLCEYTCVFPLSVSL